MRNALTLSVCLAAGCLLLAPSHLPAQPAPVAADSGDPAASAGSSSRLEDLRRQLAKREQDHKQQSLRVGELRQRLAELQTARQNDESGSKTITPEIEAAQRELADAERLLERIGSDWLQLAELTRMVETEGDDSAQPADSAKAAPAPEPQPAETQKAEPAETVNRPTAVLSPEVADAQERIRAKQEAIGEMEAGLRRLASRKVALERQIEIEQNLLHSAQQSEDELGATLSRLDAELTEKLDAGMPREELRTLQNTISERRADLQAARADVRERTAEISRLRGELTALQSEQVTVLNEVQRRRGQMRVALWEGWATAAAEFVRYKGPPIVAVLLSMLALWWMVNWFARRLVRLLMAGGRGTHKERQDRADTLSGFSENALRVALLVGGVLMLLQIAGIPVAPLLGGAAVLGLAVAFGAQNLIRDYFFGFVILFENQYRINDVIRINGMTGLVERVTLRLTQLRDVEGRVYFIPNGQINSVINLTHSWARVVVDMGVAYKENVNQVMQVLMSLASEMRNDPQYQDYIVAEPEMYGVDQFTDSAVVVRIGMRVRPEMQWVVKREFLRRIKNRFDELGIEIPFPQRMLHFAQRDEPAPDDAPFPPLK